MKATTRDIENKIDRAKSKGELDQILSELPKTTFVVRIAELCDKYGRNFSQLQIETGITKSLFYSIVNGKRKPQKPQIIKIGLSLGLALEELNELLKLAQHKELYAKKSDDAIIIYGIKNKLRIDQIQELLDEHESKLKLLE